MDEERINQRIEEFRRKTASVDYSISLPDSELEIMMAIWDSPLPVTRKTMLKITYFADAGSDIDNVLVCGIFRYRQNAGQR